MGMKPAPHQGQKTSLAPLYATLVVHFALLTWFGILLFRGF
jgi:hypothetical protein